MKKIFVLAALALSVAGCPDKGPSLEEKAEARAAEMVNSRLAAPADAAQPAAASPPSPGAKAAANMEAAAGRSAAADTDAEPTGQK